MSKCFSVSIVFATLAMIPNAANACDAELIKSLRTTYQFSENTEISEAVRHLSCGTNESNNSIGVNYAGSYGIFGFSDTGQDIATACVQNDRAFFQRNAKQIAYSFVPETVLRACTHGVYFYAKQSSDEDIITIRAVYIPSGPEFAKIRKIEIQPRSALDCGDPDLKAGMLLSPSAVSMICERKIDKGFGIRLATDRGDQEIFVARKRNIEIKPIKWDHYVGGDTSTYKCVDMSDKDAPIPYGEYVNCNQVNTCGREEHASGYCASVYGSKAVFIDGTRSGMIKP